MKIDNSDLKGEDKFKNCFHYLQKNLPSEYVCSRHKIWRKEKKRFWWDCLNWRCFWGRVIADFDFHDRVVEDELEALRPYIERYEHLTKREIEIVPVRRDYFIPKIPFNASLYAKNGAHLYVSFGLIFTGVIPVLCWTLVPESETATVHPPWLWFGLFVTSGTIFLFLDIPEDFDYDGT